MYRLLVTFQNLIDYFHWWCRIDFECSFQVQFNFDHGMIVVQLCNTILFNLFSIFQFSRMLGVLHGGIVASLSRLRRICGKLQSIAYVATEFIERSTWYMSLKTIDFPSIRKFYCYKFAGIHCSKNIRLNTRVNKIFKSFHYAACFWTESAVSFMITYKKN